MRGFLAIALVAAGCAQDDTVVFEEDFECGAGLCGWKAGPDAEVVASFHPGEHELHLPTPDRATRTLAAAVGVDACARVELVTDCFWGDDGGTWRGPNATIVGGSLVIGLSPQAYELEDHVEEAAIPGPASFDAVEVDNPSWDCTADAIRVVEPAVCP